MNPLRHHFDMNPLRHYYVSFLPQPGVRVYDSWIDVESNCLKMRNVMAAGDVRTLQIWGVASDLHPTEGRYSRVKLGEVRITAADVVYSRELDALRALYHSDPDRPTPPTTSTARP